LPTMDNVIAVRNTVARLISDIHRGRLKGRLAVGLAPFLTTFAKPLMCMRLSMA
jgi:hypothetical protein